MLTVRNHEDLELLLGKIEDLQEGKGISLNARFAIAKIPYMVEREGREPRSLLELEHCYHGPMILKFLEETGLFIYSIGRVNQNNKYGCNSTLITSPNDYWELVNQDPNLDTRRDSEFKGYNFLKIPILNSTPHAEARFYPLIH